MIPSTRNVLDLAEAYLRETLAAGWGGRHPVQAVADHHLKRGGTVNLKETKPHRGARPLYPDYSAAGHLGLRMLDMVGTLDPELRKALELRAEGHSCQDIGKHLRCSGRKAHEVVNQATLAGRMFLLLR